MARSRPRARSTLSSPRARRCANSGRATSIALMTTNYSLRTERSARKMPTDDELTAPIESRERAPRPASPPAQKAPVVKQSYEASADVRRWLQEQALDASSKPPFEPSLLAGRRDRDWILSSLTHFYERDLITDVLQEVSSGKEATVYRCAADPSTGVASLAAKVY